MTAARPCGTQSHVTAAGPGQGTVTGTAIPAGPASARRDVNNATATRRHKDTTSYSPSPGWPRLLSLEQAGAYLGVSAWTVREWVNDGSLPIVEARRPRTASALKHRPAGANLRRLLVDRHDLDVLADSFTRVRR